MFHLSKIMGTISLTSTYGNVSIPCPVIARNAANATYYKTTLACESHLFPMPEITATSVTVLWSSWISATLCEVGNGALR